jgi:hypothetical protein
MIDDRALDQTLAVIARHLQRSQIRRAYQTSAQPSLAACTPAD